MISLILGAEKSGKSAFALSQLALAPWPHWFVATGRALDADFAARIGRHRQERPAAMPVAETILDLPETLARLRYETAAAAILADSLDFWLFSCLCADVADERVAALADALDSWSGEAAPELILVSAEAARTPTGRDNVSRDFTRALGALNQDCAGRADKVALVVAGLPLWLKEPVG